MHIGQWKYLQSLCLRLNDDLRGAIFNIQIYEDSVEIASKNRLQK